MLVSREELAGVSALSGPTVVGRSDSSGLTSGDGRSSESRLESFGVLAAVEHIESDQYVHELFSTKHIVSLARFVEPSRSSGGSGRR